MGTIKLLGKPNKLRGVTCDGLASCPARVEILLAASCYGNWDKLWPDEPVWLQGFTFFSLLILDHDQPIIDIIGTKTLTLPRQARFPCRNFITLVVQYMLTKPISYKVTYNFQFQSYYVESQVKTEVLCS